MKHYLLFFLCLWYVALGQTLTIERMMSEPYLWGERVSEYIFSPDGNILYFKQGEHAFVTDLISHTTDTLHHPFPEEWLNKFTYLYNDAGKVFTFDTQTKTSSVRYHLDEQLDIKEKGIFKYLLKDSSLVVTHSSTVFQKTLPAGINRRYRIETLSKSGRYALIIAEDDVTKKKLFFPNYLPTYTEAEATHPIVDIPMLTVYLYDGVENRLTKIYHSEERGFSGTCVFSDDESQLAFSFQPVSRKKILFFSYDVDLKNLNLLYTAESEKWVAGSYDTQAFSPDSKKLLFIALKDGYERLFMYDFTENEYTLLSEFDAEITNAWWMSDRDILLISNKKTPLERHIYTLNIEDGSVVQISKTDGYIRKPELSPNRWFLAYQFSQLATPDELYLFDIKTQKETKLSATIPKEYHALNIRKPELLKTRSTDDQFDIYANFYTSDRSKKPLIVFVHGAGILQNVLNGWTPAYHREFLFHQFLIQKGYHVIDVDYRGSKGYSHDFSTDVYSHLGKKELEDIVRVIDHLDEKGLIDRDRVGIYGGSYGGFMAAYAMAFQPDLFKAGAALRSVFKWENYYYTNEWYTRARLNVFETHKDWYERSSPIYHTDKIKHPLLILHGMQDDNVPFQDAVQMTQRMIDGGKVFDLMMYPKENHGFVFPKSWIDEYKRIYNYFEIHVK